MVQYIYDSKGKKTGVIIPIEVWEKSKLKIIEMESSKDRKKDFHPSLFRGIYSNMKLDLQQEARKLREEWVRI
ncbi:MAG: hypothetical protein KO316_04860 [Methanobacterium sp.]|jgi:hypothetical protein|nr:hypothetical protein [Methanobacterium sp.]